MSHTTTSPRTLARLAGVLYLLITVAAIVAHFYVPAQLIVPGDVAATAANIRTSGALFRLGIGSEFIVLLSEVMLSLILYILFRPVSKGLALSAAVFRLAMTTIHGINLLNSFFVMILLSDAAYLSAFTSEQVHALVQFFLDAHGYGFTIGIVFLAPHVFILGYLIVRSGYVPRILGGLFLLAGIGYLIDSTALLLVPAYTTTPGFIALIIAVAEIAFPLWLLIKGVQTAQDYRTLLVKGFLND
ncbi:MAG: DUF4386 domain-containing protein [Blastochloris sp.]|nr:DUF4386 domain-containing protein [Blastochloris sp.]